MSTTTVKEYRGVRDVVYAEILKDDLNEYETGEVKELVPVSTISKNVETSSNTKYYDNTAALVITARGADTVTFDTSVLELETLADITGQTYDEETAAIIDGGEAPNRYFAVGYKMGEVGAEEDSELYVWKYKVKFSIPSDESSSEDDGTDSNGQQLECTCINTKHKFTKTGKTAMGICVDSGKGLADLAKFFEEVTTPDTLKAKTPGA